MTRTSSRTAESRFRGAIAASLDAFFLLEEARDEQGVVTDFRFVELNGRGEDFLGRPRAAVVGNLLSEIIPSSGPSGFLGRCVRVAETGESFAEEVRSDDPTLVARWIHHQVVRVEDGIVITSRDITASKWAEKSLRASEERFRLLIEAATDGIYRVDVQGRFIYANPVASRILGMGAGENLVGKHYLHFVRADYRMAGVELYARQIRDCIPVTYWEFPVVKPDGHEVWIGQNVQVEMRSGQVAELFAVARDITAQRKAEDGLRESEERHRFLADHSSDMLARQGADGRFVYVSPVCHTLLGKDPSELLGHTFAEICEAADVAAVEAGHARLAQDRRPEVISWRVRRGVEQVWLETTIQPILDDATGATMGVLSVSRDVTERRRLEEELRQVQKMEAVGQLAGGVAHDFNNLLTAIRGFSDLLALSMPDDDPRRGDLHEIVSATDRAAALTRQLLAFSRRQVLRPEHVDLNSIVGDVARVLHRMLGDRIAVQTRLEPSLSAVRADPGQLEQALLNLALNARDAMKDKGGTLIIETANVDVAAQSDGRHAPGRYAVLRVIDDGVGIASDVRDRLFEPFFTTKERGRGTGLGLSMVYGIVTQSGGFITVASEPGQGAKFAIHLPSAQPRVEAPSVHAPARSATAGNEGATILIAEDNEGVLLLAERVLGASGYHVLSGRDGVEALEVSRKHTGRIDLLLTDVMMPRMNGGELARAFAAERPEAMIAMMSGYMDEDALRLTLADSDTPFLQKPFSAAILRERVREILQPVEA